MVLWALAMLLEFFLRVTFCEKLVGGELRAHNAKDNGKEVVCRRHYSVIPTNLSPNFFFPPHISDIVGVDLQLTLLDHSLLPIVLNFCLLCTQCS